MSEILRRAWAPHLDLEVRAGGNGRTVYGLAVPYDTPTTIRERGHVFDEVFRMGSFADTIKDRGDRVKFLSNHNKSVNPLGRATMLREDAAGLVGEFEVADTQAGNEALELIRMGALDSLSVGFVELSGGSRGVPGRDPVVERLAVKLMEVSAVAFPAYEGAMISGVRADENEDHGPDQAEAVPDQDDAPDQRNRERTLGLLDLDLEGVQRWTA